MKRLFPAALLMALAFTGGRMTARPPVGDAPVSAVAPGGAGAQVAVWFSPDGGCTEAIVRELRGAREEVLVQAYSFTSAPIAAALRDAHRRGVKVSAVLDESNRGAQYTSATFLINAGIPVAIDGRHAIAHNKVMVIDGRVVITGSFNFTRAAEQRNAENLLILRSAPDLARAYRENFRAHLAHSEPYRRTGRAAPPSDGGAGGATPAAARAAGAADTVVVTGSGKAYHRADCPGLRQSRSRRSVSRKEAAAMGRTPCSICKP